jgi:hypothetical protein
MGDATHEAGNAEGAESAKGAKSETDDQPAKASRSRAQETPPTPFDHPLFLPALLFLGMLWFGYDGWINQDPDMLEHQDFNRIGFGVLTALTGWFGYRGYFEWQEEKATKDAGDPPHAVD